VAYLQKAQVLGFIHNLSLHDVVKSEKSGEPSEEESTLKSLQQDARQLSKLFEPLAKIKSSDAEVLIALERAIATLPAGEHVARVVEEMRERASQALSSAREARAANIGRHEAAYLHELRANSTPVRESGDGKWRIENLELEVQKESSRARLLYNHEVVVSWKAIGSVEDLKKLLAEGARKLEAAAIPEGLLPEIIWEAYESLSRTNKPAAPRETSGKRVKLVDLYPEVRVVLTRRELRSGKADKRLANTEMPKWAFLFNLDRYRRLLPSLSVNRRLTFETGSQQDHAKGLAMAVNGLDPTAEYKSFCFVYIGSTSAPDPSLLL
jgi:hypothetical protein